MKFIMLANEGERHEDIPGGLFDLDGFKKYINNEIKRVQEYYDSDDDVFNENLSYYIYIMEPNKPDTWVN